MIAQIAVSAATFAIDRAYSYSVGAGMCLQPGMRVIVPFGQSNRKVEGIVLSVSDGCAEGLKPIHQLLDTEPLLSPVMLRMAAFMRERFFCTFYEAARAMLPAGLWFKTKSTYFLTEDRSWQEKTPRQPDALALLQCLEACGGSTDGETLSRVLEDEESFAKAVAYLLKKKWIRADTDHHRRIGDKTEKVAVLACSAEEALAFASGRKGSGVMQRNVLELMASVGSASVKDICYFTGAGSATVRRLAELGYLTLQDRPVLRCRQIVPAKLEGPLVLNREQQTAFEGLLAQMQREDPGAALLYGVTGSGKTAVYIKLIEACLEKGKQAVLLVPEIALTPQLLGLMAAYFGENVAVLHSSLPTGERYDQWKRVRSGEAKVIVGTRSAVFAPCSQLGLIILDEEQEHSYKSENSPRYSAREVAMWRGLKEKALVLLGSATPAVETMYHARQGHMALYTLPGRYNRKPLPKVQIVDMHQELEMGNDLSLSLPLQEEIRKSADQGHQSILFLNRRGASRALVCVDCRKAPECVRCSARLTYHSANGRLMCHYCGYSLPVPKRCPDCGGPMKQVGVGTQKVQQELQTVFSDLEVARMDADTVSAVNTHEKILEHFKQDRVPILVGTQMVTKGLDIPNVTLVGVLDADLSLYAESYRSAENTFNMLTQVVGRAGRGDAEGQAVIQTMVPKHRVIELAARQDYESFYAMELELRRIQNAPPFGDQVLINLTGRDEGQLLRGGAKLRESFKKCLEDPRYAGEVCTVLGPAPCPVPKINYAFRYRLTLRCKLTPSLRELIAHLLRQFARDGANRGVTAFADVNGID